MAELPDALLPNPVDFEVRAYSVLAHAAFEQFYEDLAVTFADGLLRHWQSGALMSRQLVACMACAATKSSNFLEIERDETKGQAAPTHQFSEALRESIANVRNEVEDNHGISLSYLRSMFAPLGIHIDPDPSTQSALTLIAKNRGTFAHRRSPLEKGRYAHRPLATEQIIEYVEIVSEYCVKLENELEQMFLNDAIATTSLHRRTSFVRLAAVLHALGRTKMK